MSITDVNKIREQLSHILATIEPVYVNALLELHKRLDQRHVPWVLGGDLGEAFRTIQVNPDCIEILTDKKSAAQIFLTFKDLAPKGIFFQTQRLERNALVEQKEYPVYVRSYYFEFNFCGLKVKVHGDLQFRVGAWEWGDKLEFTPEYLSVAGARTAIVPLHVKYEIYQALGWTDRSEKISRVLKRHHTNQ